MLFSYLAESPHRFIFRLCKKKKRPLILKTWHHLIKITLPLVDELQRERGIVVPGQTEGASTRQLYQITGSGLNQSQRNTTDRRGRGTKTGGGRKSAAVSTGVIKTNSLGLSEEREGERKKQSPPFNLLPSALSFLLTSRRRDGWCTWAG